MVLKTYEQHAFGWSSRKPCLVVLKYMELLSKITTKSWTIDFCKSIKHPLSREPRVSQAEKGADMGKLSEKLLHGLREYMEEEAPSGCEVSFGGFQCGKACRIF